MSKKSATRIRSQHAVHFYVIFAAVTFFVGVFATIIWTQVFAQSNETISACVQKVSGNMRIVTANESCKSNEYALSWNKQGPVGPQGDPGSTATAPTLPFSCSYCVLYPVADKFKGKDLSNAMITRSEFQGADISGINFTGAVMSNVNFANANLTGANFTNAGNYPGWNFAGVDFENANLTNVNFTDTNLQGARNLSTATITGAIWKNTKCPDGTNSDENGNTCVGHFN